MLRLKDFLLEDTSTLQWWDTSFNPKTFNALIAGVNDNSILVHVRQKDGTNFKYGLEPSAGPTLQSTDAYQTALDEYGEGPELIFMDDSFGWINHYNIAGIKEILFIPNNETIVQSMGDGIVKEFSGRKIKYELSVVADYDNPVYRYEPAGVERNDYYSNKIQDVIASIDVVEFKKLYKG